MAYFIASENLQGKYEDSGNTILIVKYDFEVDTESDLPAQNQFSSDGVKIAMTSTAHVIENNKKFEMQSDGTWSDITTSSGGGGGGATVYLTADNIAYDNTTSGLTADDVQEALDEIVSELPVVPSTYDADDINYDNTTSGLTATNVQDALDEIVSDIPSIPSTYDADDIVYDNTTSGMTATNVQDAIDELNTDLSGKQDTLTFDNTPTQSSTNPVTSDGIYTALSGKENTLTFDTIPTASSTNPVTSGGVYTALSGKQDTLTFDTTPTQGSNNPVTSDGIYAAIQGGGGGGSDVDTLHNGCFRGKYLGDTITAEQLDAIYTGTFDDIYVGDYWTIRGMNWRVAAINYFLNYSQGNYNGSTHPAPTENHVILFPDDVIDLLDHGSNGISFETQTLKNAYGNSLVKSYLDTNRNSIISGMGSPLNVWFNIVTRNAQGNPSTATWEQTSLIIPSVGQMAGYYLPDTYAGELNRMFSLFRYTNKFFSPASNKNYWLVDVKYGTTAGNYCSALTNNGVGPRVWYPANLNGVFIRPYYIMKGIPLPD